MAFELGGLAHIRDAFEMMPDIVRELAAVEIERWPPLRGHDGEGKRQRGVGDIGAADVEQPGDGMRVGDHKRIRLEPGDLGTQTRNLARRIFAGEPDVMQRHRAERHRRAVVPDRVDQVGLHCDQRGTRRRARFRKPIGAFDGVQPRVVSDAVAGGRMLLDPPAGRHLHKMLDGKEREVDLVADLQRVAAVDEQHRAVHQDDRRTGGAGKSCQPGEPLLAGGNVFILMAVGAWHDETGQSASCKFGSQCRESRAAGGAIVHVVE